MRNKLLAMILAAAMVLTMTPILAVPVNAADEGELPYINGYIPVEDSYTANGVEMVKESVSTVSGQSSEPGVKSAMPSQYRSDKEVWAEGIKVRNQKRTGLCWAFSVATPAEYSYAKEVYERTGKTGVVKSLSPAHIGQFYYNRVNDPLGNTYGDFNDLSSSFDWPIQGGNQQYASLHIASWSGMALESKYPIDAVNDHIIKDKNYSDVWDGTANIFPASAAYDDELTMQESIMLRHPIRNRMREMIMKYGAISCVMDFEWDKYMNLEEINPETGEGYYGGRSFYNYTGNFGGNHALTIVGWDDNYPKENFTHTIESEVEKAKEDARVKAQAEAEEIYKYHLINKKKLIEKYVEEAVSAAEEEAIAKTREKTTPDNDGAWIVQNSWGDDVHEHGFLYVSYESADFNKEDADLYVFDMQPLDAYKYNFQYDGTAGYADASDRASDGTRLDYYTRPGSRAANVFTNTTGEPVNIEAVGYMTYMEGDQEYDVTVYTGLKNASDPTSGKSSGTTRVKTSTRGWKTAALDEPVYVAPGETYSIVFDFNDFSAFGTEMTLNSGGYVFNAQIDPGQSFFSKSKSDKWTDMYNYKACFRIKGYANPTSLKPSGDQPQGGDTPAAAAVTETLNKKLTVPKISSAKGGKKSVTVKWKKLSKANRRKVSGIEIQYSTSKSFSKDVKTVYAAPGSKSKKIKSLTAKKRYYVRARTYKDAGSVRQVSKWSKARSAKVK